MDKAEFWATKQRAPTYETVTFEHPAFDAPIRLVANVFAEVTLGGDVYRPAPMTVKPPEANSNTPKMTVGFPRQVVGREFKQQLKLITAAGSREPITVTHGVWLGEVDAPKKTWRLYASDAGGVSFGRDQVQVSATLDNPLRLAVAPVYLPETFTGLEPL